MFKKKRLLILSSFVIVLSVFLFYALYLRGKSNITIIYTSDLQGFIVPHIEPWPDIKGKQMMGGSAYLATHLKKERAIVKKNGRAFLLLDSGDIFFGTPEGHFSRGSCVIEIMNALGYDAMTVGDRDFAFGEENLRNLAKQARFPFLGANIISEDTGKHPDYIKPYLIKEFNGIKVGIIGVTTPLMEKYTLPKHIKGLKFISPIPTVKKYASLLEEKGVHLIVLLSHLELDLDKELVREIPGIDLVIGGNDKKGWRELYADPIHGTIIGEHWNKGLCPMRFNLILDSHKNKIIKYHIKDTDIFVRDFEPDQEIATIIQRYSKEMNEKMDTDIGYAETSLTRSIDRESTLGNLVADVLKARFQADVALCAGLEADLKKGEINIGDIYEILPIINRLDVHDFNVAILELTGEDIKNILEHSVGWVLENSKDGKKHILQVSGLNYAYDPKLPRYHRVKKVLVDGEELKPGKIYKVAVNGYLAAGGDRYYDIQFAENRKETGVMAFDVLVEYIKEHSPITAPPLEGRIVRLNDTKN